MRDVIIIGAGAAGLSAAVYALGKRLNFLVIYDELCGKSDWSQSLADQDAEAYRAGSEAVNLFARRLSAHPEHHMRDQVKALTKSDTGFRVETVNNGVQESTTVIIATGARAVPLNVPYAQEFVGHGLGYSITTYANMMTGKTAAVIGTTPRALRGVGELARVAEKVYLIAPVHLDMSGMLAHTLEQRPNVELFDGYRVKEIVGDFHAGEVIIERDGQTRNLGIDAAFVDLGLQPNTDFARGLVEMNAEGFIKVDNQNATSVPGLFAAGDVTTAFGEQVVIALGEGARGALSAYDYLLAEPATYTHLPMD
jgi:thioredoxin reductase (NADPH)